MGLSWIVHCTWPSHWGICMEAPQENLMLAGQPLPFWPKKAPGLEIWGRSFYVFHTARSIPTATTNHEVSSGRGRRVRHGSFHGWITVLVRWPMLGYIMSWYLSFLEAEIAWFQHFQPTSWSWLLRQVYYISFAGGCLRSRFIRACRLLLKQQNMIETYWNWNVFEQKCRWNLVNHGDLCFCGSFSKSLGRQREEWVTARWCWRRLNSAYVCPVWICLVQ